MKIKKLFLMLLLAAPFALTPVRGDESKPHDRDKEASSKAPHPHDDASGTEGKEAKHDDEEEENSAVGPDKGVTEFHAEKGFRLSPEAMKNFGISFKSVVSTKAGFEIPVGALLEAQNGTYIYLEKSGMLKRVAIEIQKKTADSISIKSSGVSSEDKIVVSGVPFLRGAELDVSSGGGSHGH